MKALLIVDLQNDFCQGGTLATPDGDKIVPVVNLLLEQFSLVVASKDWHPEKTMHFENWPPHCIQNTEGAAFHPDLDTAKIHKIFLKGTGIKDDGYSAFEATNENLAEFLKNQGVEELFIAGLTTEYCVKNTVLDAIKKGFDTKVIKDAVEGVKANTGDEDTAYAEMKKNGAGIITSKDIFQLA